MKHKIKSWINEFVVLIRSVPSTSLSIFILAVLLMNLLANKSLNLSLNWLALDCGIIVSWVAFLCMDLLTKHFGPKAATQISIFAIVVNLCACLILYLASLIPGTWGAFYDFGENPVINSALNGTFGGVWYVVVGSTIAFITSAAINNFSNWWIGKAFHKNPDGFIAYACRTYLSTAVGQFADNLVFALLVSHIFFGWSILQCITCSVTGMIVELIIEMIFSPFGFKVCGRWKEKNVGKEYFEYLERKNRSEL